MTARVGPTQRAVLLILADGNGRTPERIEMDGLLSAGRAYPALEGLARRGYVDRRHDLHERAAVYYLTDDGQALANEVHGLGEEDGESPRCPHGRPEDEPCKECRTGPWRCDACGDVIRGGLRYPHLRERHPGARVGPGRFTWADQPG